MHPDLRPLIATWAVLALAVLILFIRRRMVASKEDDQLHVMSAANADQAVVAAKLDTIDKWGKLLTALTLVYGLVIAGLYLYSVFNGRPSIVE